ncbi:hypothetical protein C0995_005991 [Termitomyces sp. Mi166|nr:hypothetical protein C0995_005991 [Termitomyces sp. Mi166\
MSPLNEESRDDDPTVTTGTKRPAVGDDNDLNSKKQRSQTSGGILSTPSGSPSPPQRFTYREVDWITLDKESLHGQFPSDDAPTLFYVKYLIKDGGSLVGRCTRVWCVYQESTMPAAYEQDILADVMNRQKTPQGVLLPTHVWHLGEILTLVRGPTQAPSKVKNRQEIFTISPLKRTLSQFATAEEFYGAIIGALRAIDSFEATNVIHRDVSFGDITLNPETCVATDEECQSVIVDLNGKTIRIVLIRRDPFDIGTVGGLHDLDMAACTPEPQLEERKLPDILESSEAPVTLNLPLSNVKPKPHRDWRTGTLPFMSIPLLEGRQNCVRDDLQSTFFVCYLSLFTFDERPPNCFPNLPLALSYQWPKACQKWANVTVPFGMEDLGALKHHFFIATENWGITAIDEALSFWRLGGAKDGSMQVRCWNVLKSFHGQLWPPSRSPPCKGEATLLINTLKKLEPNAENPLVD